MAFSTASDFETGRGLPRNKEGMVRNWLSLGGGGAIFTFKPLEKGSITRS